MQAGQAHMAVGAPGLPCAPRLSLLVALLWMVVVLLPLLLSMPCSPSCCVLCLMTCNGWHLCTTCLLTLPGCVCLCPPSGCPFMGGALLSQRAAGRWGRGCRCWPLQLGSDGGWGGQGPAYKKTGRQMRGLYHASAYAPSRTCNHASPPINRPCSTDQDRLEPWGVAADSCSAEAPEAAAAALDL